MRKAESFTITLETSEGERSFTCNRNEFIWDAAARNGIALPAICHQGRCLTCAGRLLSGKVDQSKADSFFHADREANFVLLCTAKPCSDLRILPNQQWVMRQHRLQHHLPAPYA
jgi:ferredoxin